MYRLVTRVVLAAVAAVAGTAHAQSVSLKAGSSGIGLEASYGLTPLFGLRANVLGGSLTRDETRSGVRYDGKLKLVSSSFLVDLHPFSGSFRLTAGLTNNNNRFDATADPVSGLIEINGIEYPSSQVGTLQAEVRFDRRAPYLGLGWGSALRASAGLSFSLDFGAFLSKPAATLKGNCGPALTAPLCAQLQADIAAEQLQLQQSLDSVKGYPVLSVGFGYRF